MKKKKKALRIILPAALAAGAVLVGAVLHFILFVRRIGDCYLNVRKADSFIDVLISRNKILPAHDPAAVLIQHLIHLFIIALRNTCHIFLQSLRRRRAALR